MINCKLTKTHLTFTLRVHTSLAQGEVINKVSGKVFSCKLNLLELDDSGSKLQEAGWVVHELPCTGVDELSDQRVVTQTKL